jgi:hypothetical protein
MVNRKRAPESESAIGVGVKWNRHANYQATNMPLSCSPCFTPVPILREILQRVTS